MTTKTCTKCGETKTTDQFGKNRLHKDGLQSSCKTCRYAQVRAYREANRDKISAQRSTYRKENRDKVNAYQRAYYEENRDKMIARQRAYREANQDKIIAYREANRDKIITRQRAHSRLVGNPGRDRASEVTARYATRKYDPWTPEEDRYLLTGPGTIMDKALQLSRTYGATQQRHRLIRQDSTK